MRVLKCLALVLLLNAAHGVLADDPTTATPTTAAPTPALTTPTPTALPPTLTPTTASPITRAPTVTPPTGTPTGRGPVPGPVVPLPPLSVLPRQPVSVFFDGSSADQRANMDLFYLALNRSMSAKSTDIQSWYALAAIHGTPVKYDNVAGLNTAITRRFGYCEHGDELFPTWHRPYLLALEYAIQAHAAAYINETNLDQATKLDGYARAQALRLPYWDWDALPQGFPNNDVRNMNNTNSTQTLEIPWMFTVNTVTVINWLPVGTPSKQLPNPLLKYTLPSGVTPSLSLDPDGNSRTTLRDPTPGFYTESLRDDIAACFSLSNWLEVSNHNPPSSNPTGANIEGIHDNIHGWVGGTMGAVPVAAYDPIFWFHHCNVDRITALYQAYQPNSWPVSTTASTTTFVQSARTRISSATPLKPFRQARLNSSAAFGDNFYSSDSFRDTAVWGYVYPEVVQMQGMTTMEKRKFLNSLFPVSTWVEPGSKVSSRRLFQTEDDPTTSASSNTDAAVSWRVVFEQFPAKYFGGSVKMRVFLNTQGVTAATPTTHPNLAATPGTFSFAASAADASDSDIHTLNETDTVPVTAPTSHVVTGSITTAVKRLNLVSGTVSAPVVDFRSMEIILTGDAIASWLTSATPQQIAQLRSDIANDYFTPKIKQFQVTHNQHTGEITHHVKRYIGVPVTIIVAKDGTTDGAITGNVRSLSLDVDNQNIPFNEQTNTNNNNNNHMSLIIGVTVAGLAAFILLAATVIMYRRHQQHKSTIQVMDTQMDVLPTKSVATV